MEGSETKPMDEFTIDVGRANKGQTFVRVVHTPSGKERTVVDLNGASPQEVANRLIRELQQELEQ
jgi:hypothetical protein